MRLVWKYPSPSPSGSLLTRQGSAALSPPAGNTAAFPVAGQPYGPPPHLSNSDPCKAPASGAFFASVPLSLRRAARRGAGRAGDGGVSGGAAPSIVAATRPSANSTVTCPAARAASAAPTGRPEPSSTSA